MSNPVIVIMCTNKREGAKYAKSLGYLDGEIVLITTRDSKKTEDLNVKNIIISPAYFMRMVYGSQLPLLSFNNSFNSAYYNGAQLG